MVLPTWHQLWDLEQMMGERGVSVDHSTIYRWVQKYAPDKEKRLLALAPSAINELARGRNLYQGSWSVDVPVQVFSQNTDRSAQHFHGSSSIHP